MTFFILFTFLKCHLLLEDNFNVLSVSVLEIDVFIYNAYGKGLRTRYIKTFLCLTVLPLL